MKRLILLVPMLGALLGPVFGFLPGRFQADEDVCLRYRFSPFHGPPTGVPDQKLDVQDKPVEHLTRVPRCRSARPLYGAARLGDGPDNAVPFVLDESRGTGKGYDLLVID